MFTENLQTMFVWFKKLSPTEDPRENLKSTDHLCPVSKAVSHRRPARFLAVNFSICSTPTWSTWN